MKTTCEKCGHVQHDAPSDESRGHYFATLHDIWRNLPKDIAARFPDSEALRHWCLVREGYADEDTIACRDEAEAIRTVVLLGKFHPHSVFARKGDVLQWFRAKSQSQKTMGAKVFNESKQSVLSRAAAMIGVYDLTELAKPPKRLDDVPPPEPPEPRGRGEHGPTNRRGVSYRQAVRAAQEPEPAKEPPAVIDDHQREFGQRLEAAHQEFLARQEQGK